jgi:MFS family permease
MASCSVFSAFRSRDYTLFWAGSFVSNVGTWMQSVALGWLVYEMTGAASWLGTVSFAANAPALFVGLVGGAIADRTDRRLVLVSTQAAAAAGAFVLAALTGSHSLTIWQVITIALATGTASSLYVPVVHATLPALVPTEDLPNAVSLNSVQFNLARIVGPLLAGFAYSRLGPAGCFALNGASFVVLAMLLSRLRLPPRPIVTSGSIARQLLDGIRYARSEPLIVTMLAFAAVTSLLGFPYIILMPAVARRIDLGPDGLGIMMGVLGAGAVIGGLVLGALGDVPRKGLLAVLAGTALAAFLVVFSMTTRLQTAAPVLFLLGVMQVSCVASLNTTLQVAVVDGMRGRVMSMLSFAFFGLSTLGSVFMGFVADRLGIDRALRLGGVSILAIAAIVLLRSRVVFEPVSPPRTKLRSERAPSTIGEGSLSSR